MAVSCRCATYLLSVINVLCLFQIQEFGAQQICIVETSGDQDEYLFWRPFVPSFHDTFRFEVRASNNVYLKLSSSKVDGADGVYYSIGILKTISSVHVITAASGISGTGNSFVRLGDAHNQTGGFLHVNQSRGFEIKITPDGMLSVGFQDSQSPFLSVSVDKEIFYNTKYVGINTIGTNGTWNLCSDDDESLRLLSFGKFVSKSDSDNTDAATVVDGNDGNDRLDLCSTSDEGTDPWLRIDLEAQYDIDRVEIINLDPESLSAEARKLVGATIRVGSCEGSNYLDNQVCGDAISDSEATSGHSILRTCPMNSLAQFVYVRLPGSSKQLVLCEVKVFGRKASDNLKTMLGFVKTELVESEGKKVVLEIERSGNVDSCSSVDVSFDKSSGTARENEDFLIPESNVIFKPQELKSQVEIHLLNDNFEEIMLQLQNPVGADIKSGTSVLTIVGVKSGPVETMTTTIIASVVSVAIAAIVIAIMGICCYRKRKRQMASKRAKRTPSKGHLVKNEYLSPMEMSNPASQTEIVQDHQQPKDATLVRIENASLHQIERSRLRLHEVIGSGAFGDVYFASAYGLVPDKEMVNVAVKVLKESELRKSEFMKELEFLQSLDPHPNIIGFVGCCTDNDPYLLVLEYAPEGNLREHLHSIRKRKTQQVLKSKELLEFSLGVNKGMEYISSKNCVHRDLATRNILLGANKVCKLSDFGLARDMETRSQYEMKSGGKVPVRWMAPESIEDNIFTIKTDVWSFGIVLWELVTMGAHPYGGLNAKQVIDMVCSGDRLDKPQHCSDEMYNFMLKCWNDNPNKRPSFRDIRKQLDIMLADASGYIKMNNCDIQSYVYLERQKWEQNNKESVELRRPPKVMPKPRRISNDENDNVV